MLTDGSFDISERIKIIPGNVEFSSTLQVFIDFFTDISSEELSEHIKRLLSQTQYKILVNGNLRTDVSDNTKLHNRSLYSVAHSKHLR